MYGVNDCLNLDPLSVYDKLSCVKHVDASNKREPLLTLEQTIAKPPVLAQAGSMFAIEFEASNDTFGNRLLRIYT